MVTIKVYDGANNLHRGKFKSTIDALYGLREIEIAFGINKAFWHENGKQHTVLTGLKKNVPVFYTRSDGVKVYTLSIHPKNYPMTAHYADGSTEVLNIQ